MSHSHRRPWVEAAGLCGAGLAGAALLLATAVHPASAAPRQGPTAAAGCQDRREPAAAIGVPGEDIGSIRDAGAVEVRFGYRCDPDTTAQSVRLPHPHAGDRFGTSIARGPLNDDSIEDLAIGIPGLDVDGHADAGGVAIFLGSKTGLHYARTLTQASPGVPGTVSTGARFGAAVAIRGSLAERLALLRVGEPGRTVAGHPRAGGFVDLSLNAGRPTGGREVTLASTGIPGSPGTDDLLGSALDSTRAVGAPGRTVHGFAAAGEVLLAFAGPDYTGPEYGPVSVITQSTPGIPGTPEAGDRFGAALSQNWVGVPGESVGEVAGAGVVDRDGDNELAGITPPVAIVPGLNGMPAPTTGAHLGAALTEIGTVVDESQFLELDLVIGAPGKRVGGRAGAGRVVTVGVQEPDPDGDGSFAFTGPLQVVENPDPQAGAGFGSSLSQLFSDQVQVGAPGSAGGRVVVYDATASPRNPQPLTPRTTWRQRAGTPETGDAFGAALAAPLDLVEE